MKYFLLLVAASLMPFLSSSQSLAKALLFFGINGNTYETEVDIPIEQIRYQATAATAVFETYSATAPTAPAVRPLSPQPVITAGLRCIMSNEPSTGVPLLTGRPCVKFETSAGTRIHLPIGSNPPMPPLPPAGARLVNCSCSDPDVISYKDYLFVPAGGKMPNFSQVLRHEWFVSGPFAAMLRYRPAVDKIDDLPTLEESYSTGLSIGIVAGIRHSFKHSRNFDRHGRFYRLPMSYQLPLFMVGANTVEAKRRVDTDNNGRLDAYSDKENRVALTIGTGVGIQIWKIAIMPLVGWDFLLGSQNKTWSYQGKIWYGGSVGVSLEKLVGLAK